MEETLRNKTTKGFVWSGMDNIAQYGVSFVLSIILARLLSPEDYGLIGIVTIFTSICYTLYNAGFSNALIRKSDVDDDDFNTAFVINFVISIFLYIIIYGISPLISVFFDVAELENLIKVSSIGMILSSLSIVPATKLTIQLDFKSQTKISIISSTISGLMGIGFAIAGYGVWALVYQGLFSIIIRTILLWIICRWRPKLNFSSNSFHNLFGFGWKIMLSGVLDSIWKQLYQVVIGKVYKPATLGQYTRAIGFSQLFSSNLTSVIQRVTFPVLSSIQDDKVKMLAIYRKLIRTTMFVTAIMMFFLGAIAEPLLYCLIGPKWHDAANYLTLICINESLYPLHAINLNMLEVQGRSDIFLGLEIIKKILLSIPLFIGIIWGIIPMLYINILIGVICFFLNSHYSGSLIGYSSWLQVKDVSPSYGVAILISLGVYPIKFIPLSNWALLPIQIIVGISIFVIACKVFKIKDYYYILEYVRPVVTKMFRI